MSVQDQVTSMITQQTNWAEKFITSANQALAALGDFDYPYTIFSNLLNPTIRVELKPASNLQNPPTVGTPPKGADLKVPSIPPYTSLELPSEPDLVPINIPSSPPLDHPQLGLVSLPTLTGVTIPNAPAINFGAFSVPPPTPITLSPHSFDFNLDTIVFEGEYLYRLTYDQLSNIIANGGLVLPTTIEDDIWNRNLEREQQQLIDTTDKVTTMWAKKGFSLPDGMLAHSLSETQKDYENRRIDRAREIAVTQAKLQMENLFKAISEGRGLLLGMKELLLRNQALLLQKQEDMAKFFNEYTRLQVEIQNNVVDIYKARVQAYEVEIRALLGQVEVYKAQIEGELGKTKINEQLVTIYTDEITAAIAKQKGSLDCSKLQVDIFSAQVQAVLAQEQVNMDKVKTYAEKVNALVAKAELYKAEVSGLEAVARVGVAQAEINTANINAWAKGIEVQLSYYEAEVEKFKAENAYNIAAADVASKVSEINSNVLLGTMKINESYNELNLKSMQEKANAQLESARAIAQMTGNMAAGAMSALTTGAHESYGESRTMREGA